jgi:hypothetical protein
MRQGRGRVNRSLSEKVESRQSRNDSSIILRAHLRELVDTVHSLCRIGPFSASPRLCVFHFRPIAWLTGQ